MCFTTNCLSNNALDRVFIVGLPANACRSVLLYTIVFPGYSGNSGQICVVVVQNNQYGGTHWHKLPFLGIEVTIEKPYHIV